LIGTGENKGIFWRFWGFCWALYWKGAKNNKGEKRAEQGCNRWVMFRGTGAAIPGGTPLWGERRECVSGWVCGWGGAGGVWE
jgi:hypothetical protein